MWENKGSRAFWPFSTKYEKSMLLVSILASFWEPFGIHFRYFFGIDFCMPFWIPLFRFLVENGRQMALNYIRGGEHFGTQKRSKNTASIFHRFGIDLGSHVGHILVLVWHDSLMILSLFLQSFLSQFA